MSVIGIMGVRPKMTGPHGLGVHPGGVGLPGTKNGKKAAVSSSAAYIAAKKPSICSNAREKKRPIPPHPC
jgi:hypothetical protein